MYIIHQQPRFVNLAQKNYEQKITAENCIKCHKILSFAAHKKKNFFGVVQNGVTIGWYNLHYYNAKVCVLRLFWIAVHNSSERKIEKSMIEIKNIVKKYGNLYAVKDISFTIGTGEIVGFLGPNGAGKSTTMNILTGYLSATSGSAKIDGIDILENPIAAKRRIGFLPEQPPLYLDMTVKEYLNFVYELKHCTLDRKKHLSEICEVVKIGNVYDRIIGHLSKGYRQRVGIAQALVGNPPVLIFDEPTVGLDPQQIIEIRNLISTLGQKHTVILSTHILSEVQAVCDRIIVINKGELVADNKTSEIGTLVGGARKLSAKIAGDVDEVLSLVRNVDGVKSVKFDSPADNGCNNYIIEQRNTPIEKQLFYALSRANLPLCGLCDVQMSLEDVFIALIENKAIAENTRKEND